MASIGTAFINSVHPPAEGYKIHWDSKLSGYGVRVNAKGTKSFVVQGRVKGVSVLFTIGPFGKWTEHEARARAKVILQDMCLGKDPRDMRRLPDGVPTLGELADEYVNRPRKDMKASSKDAIKRHIKTTFKNKEHELITSISEAYCIERYETKVATAPGSANQSHAVLKALLNYAIRRRKGITKNPCDAVTKEDRVVLDPRTSYIKPNRIGKVWGWLTEQRAQAYTQGAMGRFDLARFLLWTGCRLGEALTLEWTNVSTDEAWWHLPDPKNRNPLWLPLSTQAVDMLKVRRAEVPKNVPWVFPSYRSKSGHMEDPREVLWDPISELAGEEISAHDCRRSWTNYALRELDMDYYRVELLTGHLPTSVTLKHYTDTSDLRRWTGEVQKVSDYIDRQAAIAASSNVVPLKKTG